jgi:hypothetical protein
VAEVRRSFDFDWAVSDKCGLVSPRNFADGLAELKHLCVELPADRSLKQESDLLSGQYLFAYESIENALVRGMLLRPDFGVGLAELQKRLVSGGILETLRNRESQLVLNGGPLKKTQDMNLTRGLVLGGFGALGLILSAVFSSKSSRSMTSLDISACSSPEAESERSKR